MTATATKHAEPAAARRDLYAEITSKIVAQLEQGVRPWAKPWNAERRGSTPTTGAHG